jgi:FkbH-like protein
VTAEVQGIAGSEFAARLAWPPVLFADSPSRRELLGLHAAWPLGARRIRVHRNHAVELGLSVARPYLEFAGIAPEWLVGDYDDSLAMQVDGDADAEVVWLDWARFAERMTAGELREWLAGRLAALRARTSAPILLVGPDIAGYEAPEVEGVAVGDLGPLLERLGDEAFDPDRAEMTGTRWSAAGAVAAARELGGRWLPALLAPRIKAIAVDLDQTLYAGVLGEDGPSGVELTEGHAALQRRLTELHESGVLLALVSRNEPADVEALFAERDDFPLRLDDVDASSIGWGAKSDGVRAVAADLNIDPGAVLFVDDNAGELLQVQSALPGVPWLQAADDAADTARWLGAYPGLFAFARTEADTLRAADLRANRERESALAGAGEDLGAYLRELGVTLTFEQQSHLERVAELSGKTNQFNLALARLSDGDVRARDADPAYQISTARLQDRLTDSGIIAIAIARRDGGEVVVEELCVSCRALGRRIEDLIVAGMLAGGRVFDGADEVRFAVAEGPRNAPARDWLARFAGGRGTASVSAARVREAATHPDVTIKEGAP